MLIKVNNKFPTIEENTYIAPTSSVIGDVILKSYSSIWFGAVVRADNGSIKIGERTESLFFYMWPFHFVLSIGMGLMCLVAFLQFIEDIHSYVKGDHFTQEIEAATDV